MRVLLDEMMPRRLTRHFDENIQAVTVRERGWGSLGNGELLQAAQREFDVLLTMDRGIPHQQDLSKLEIAVVILCAKSNRFTELEPLMDEVVRALSIVRSGQTLFVGEL